MHSGPNIEADGLVFAVDPTSRRTSLRYTNTTNNILLDPNLWTTGTGGFTGYNANGSSSEQNRVIVNDDPWGRTSVTWRTTPDSTSGADGGWNSSYYPIDRAYTYRWSIWVRRYTIGTGGTFYLGLNPAPIRNDNGASQGNPYFHCPAISNLAYYQWYLVVGHIFYEGYSGGRHPDSGWYTNGEKISDIGFCNMGGEDGRWASTTTSSMLRAYHYYTTNTASGIEFAYPRLDKIDGKEPSIREMISVGESGMVNLGTSGANKNVKIPVSPSNYSSDSTFILDGTDDFMSFNNPITVSSPYTVLMWCKPDTLGTGTTSTNRRTPLKGNGHWNPGIWATQNMMRSHGNTKYTDSYISWSPGTWAQIGMIFNGSNVYNIFNGQILSSFYNPNYSPGNPSEILIGAENTSGASTNWDGEIGPIKFYNKVLTVAEIQQNFLAYKNRFNIS